MFEYDEGVCVYTKVTLTWYESEGRDDDINYVDLNVRVSKVVYMVTNVRELPM